MRSVVFVPRTVPPSAMAASLRTASDRQSYRELGAAAGEVLRADVPTVSLRDRLRDREAQASAIAHRVLTAIETLEETYLRSLGQARPLVAHSHDDRSVGALAAHPHGRAAGRVLHGVVEQVEEELRELVGIAVDRRQPARVSDLEPNAGVVCLHVHRRDRAFDESRRRDLLA